MPTLDLREQEPLSGELRKRLAEEIERRVAEHGSRVIGQTALSHTDLCPRSGALYLIFGGGVETHATARGTLAHSFCELATNYLLSQGETSMPPEVGKDWMQALISERTDLALPEYEQDALRVFAWNWCWGTLIDPRGLICNETSLHLQIGDWTIRGRVDRVDQLPDGSPLVRDYKSGLNLPAQEAYEKGPEAFQPKTYGLLYLEGADENGMRLGERAAGAYVRLELPRRMNEETGELAHREAYLTRAELHDFRLSVERLLGVLDEGLETGEFPAVPGAHCATCPAAHHCPIDEHYRTIPGEQDPPSKIPTIESLAEAEELATERLFLDSRARGIQKAMREWSKPNGPIYVGTDLVYDFDYQESRSVRDYDALTEAIHRAVEYGEPFELADHIQLKRSTPYRKRRIKEEEKVEQ